MQVQLIQSIRQIVPGATGIFDVVKSNAPFKNAQCSIVSLDIASYTIRTYVDNVLYAALNVTRTNERAIDILILTPLNRYMLPNLGTGMPGDFTESNPLYAIRYEVRIQNTGQAIATFDVSSTWEINPPR